VPAPRPEADPYHDALTGLANRRLLDDRLAQALALAARKQRSLAILVVDLHAFREVNERLGHDGGDAVLRETARRLAGCLRRADTLARTGGDEFAVLLPELEAPAECEVVAGKMLRALGAAFEPGGVTLAAAIGASLFPADAQDAAGLLRNADDAMRRAKTLGRNRFAFHGR
jgi:diguanylate cyclase (GGDEF)-like protein